MSGLQEIEVLIRPDGEVQVRVRGVKGGGCRELTAELERYLGGRVLQRRHTDEFQEQAQREESAEQTRVGEQ
jgi:hypothetical protein